MTQTIAADLFDRGASAIRFPSRLDGNACVAIFEGRGTASSAGEPIALTDPPPEPLTNATAPWGLVLEPAPTAPARSLSAMTMHRTSGQVVVAIYGAKWGQTGGLDIQVVQLAQLGPV